MNGKIIIKNKILDQFKLKPVHNKKYKVMSKNKIIILIFTEQNKFKNRQNKVYKTLEIKLILRLFKRSKF